MGVNAMKLSDVRKKLKECCDQVYEGKDILITRKKNENVVLISEERYNALIGKTSKKNKKNSGKKAKKEKIENEIETKEAKEVIAEAEEVKEETEPETK